MSEPRNGGSVKTLGIKVPDALHAQFALVAQLDGISLGDAAIRAVELYVTTKKAEPDFAARARLRSKRSSAKQPPGAALLRGCSGRKARRPPPTSRPPAHLVGVAEASV